MRLRHCFGKKTSLLIGIGIILIGLGGREVYAALGGTAHPQAASDIELQRGLVGWWKLDGNAKDSTPYADNGVITGATPVADREGQSGAAYDFLKASSQYITVPAATILRPTQAISTSAWIYNRDTASTSAQLILSTRETGGYSLMLSGNAINTNCPAMSVCFGIQVGGTYHVVSYAKSNLVTATWYHVVGTYDGSTESLYINGSVVAQASFSGAVSYNTTPICIGSEASLSDCISQGGSWDGRLDDVRVYNRALSGSEVAFLSKQYGAKLSAAGGENGLVAWWKLDGNLKDSSPYSQNAVEEFGITPKYTTDRKGRPFSAQLFNGSNEGDAVNYTNKNLFPNADWTVALWANNDFLTSSLQMFGGNADSSGKSYPVVSSVDSSTLRVNFYDNGGNYYQWDISPSIVFPTSGQWAHISLVKQGPNLYWYRNGQQVASTNTAPAGPVYTPDPAQGNFVFGSNAGLYFSGALDDFRIYSRALSQQDIQAIYNSYDSQVSLYSPVTPSINSGLLGYWAFSGNLNDGTPYGNNGSMPNGGTYVADRKGVMNNAVDFNSTNSQYVAIPGTTSPKPVNQMSVSLWVKQAAVMQNTALIARWHFDGNYSDNAEGPWALQTANNDGSRLRLFITTDYGDGGNNYVDTPVGSWTAGIWHHVVFTYDYSQIANYTNAIRMYIDGVPQTLTVTGTPGNHGLVYPAALPDIRIGDFQNLNRYWNGSVDDVRIYSRVLSSTEVQQLYMANN